MIVMKPLYVIIFLFLFFSCNQPAEVSHAEQWKTIDITFNSETSYANPYTDVEMWAEFRNESGMVITAACPLEWW